MYRILSIIIAFALFAVCPLSGQPSQRNTKSESIVHIDGTNYYIHNVREGETIYSLTGLYEVTEVEISTNNPLSREGLRVGQVLKIPVKQLSEQTQRRQSKLFETHIVRQEETAYSIARSYGISLSALIEDNPDVDPTRLPIGYELNIRKKEMGETQPWKVTKQWEEYRNAANNVSDDYVYHIVKPGETIYSLSRMFSVSEKKLKELNLLEEGLKANSIIRIPLQSSPHVAETKEVITNNPNSSIPINQDLTIDFSNRNKTFRFGQNYNIALLLPLEDPSANSDFFDFYRGTLLAFEELKSDGHSMKVTVYNTARSANKVRNIISSSAFSNIDLIIGPVYETEMAPALQYAEEFKIPIVSPLAPVKELDSEMLYQMAPDPRGKYDKLGGLLASGKNIIFLSSGSEDDREFESEIVNRLGEIPYGRFTLGQRGDVASLIDWNRENIFVVLSNSELGVDKALASISSAYNNASARTSRRADIKVLGSPKWAHYNSNTLDKTLFFKLNVCFVTSYYIDRTNSVVAKFEAHFLETYGNLPSRSAYRGYDAVKLFAGALYKPETSYRFTLATDLIPLQMPYKFVQSGSGYKRYVNDQWAFVCFQNDYNIVVK